MTFLKSIPLLALALAASPTFADEGCVDKEVIQRGSATYDCYVQGNKVRPPFGEFFLVGRVVRVSTDRREKYELYSIGDRFLVSCDNVVAN